ncbi:MAG: radical SAM protein, partial [Gemmatimonadetes bacterium]|nr:radical SAM protein [Gemmatimonadota bacterium]
MKIFIETHGCQMNFSDTEIVGGLLEANGVSVVDNLDDADGVFVNTCAIRENAEEKVYHRVQQLSYLKRKKPDLIVGILGCLAQSLKEDILEYSSAVDLVVGPDSYRTLPELLAKLAPGEIEKIVETKLSRTENYTDIPTLRKSGVNAWVTIMRGCDNFCTFCVVPYTRGRERSRSADLVVKEVESLAAAGFVQVTLLGQNVNSYRTEN